MNMTKLQKAKIDKKGHLTIPENIRKELVVEDGCILNIILLGKAIIITPRKPGLPEATPSP